MTLGQLGQEEYREFSGKIVYAVSEVSDGERGYAFENAVIHTIGGRAFLVGTEIGPHEHWLHGKRVGIAIDRVVQFGVFDNADEMKRRFAQSKGKPPQR